MIINTPQSTQATKPFPELYVPIDPKYFYSNYKTSDKNYQLDHYNTQSNSWNGFEMDYFLRQKMDTILSRIHMLYSEIEHRYILKNTNIYQINRDQCTCKDLIFTIGEEFFDKNRIQLEEKILDLEQEKRREKAGFFRDLTFLNKELRDSLIEKLEEEQKKSLVLGQGEEIP